MNLLTDEQIEQAKKVNVANVLKKLKAGKVLTASQQRILDGDQPKEKISLGNPNAKGQPIKIIRWSLKQASEEFGVNIQTMTRKLKSNGALPGDDKKYSTRQIFDSLTVDFETKKEQLELLKEQRRHTAARASILENKWVMVDIVSKVWSDVMVDLRQKVINSNLPAQEKTDLLADMQTIPVENYFVDLEKEKPEVDEE